MKIIQLIPAEKGLMVVVEIKAMKEGEVDEFYAMPVLAWGLYDQTDEYANYTTAMILDNDCGLVPFDEHCCSNEYAEEYKIDHAWRKEYNKRGTLDLVRNEHGEFVIATSQPGHQ